jgi:hypothetical protein
MTHSRRQGCLKRKWPTLQGRTLPTDGRGSTAAAVLFLTLCSNVSSAAGGAVEAVFLLALQTSKVSTMLTSWALSAPETACAPVNDLPHINAYHVLRRGAALPRDLRCRNLRAAHPDVRAGTSQHATYQMAPVVHVPGLVCGREAAAAKALQERRLASAEVAFDNELQVIHGALAKALRQLRVCARQVTSFELLVCAWRRTAPEEQKVVSASMLC